MNKRKEEIRILYVEDDETLSYLTKDNLELNGYLVILAGDGKQALELFRQEEFHLCVVDIMLPEMDGFTLAEEIRRVNRDIPILFLSAKSLVEDRIKGLSLGADDYITKPFSIKELILRIEVFLKRSQVLNDNNNVIYTIGSSEFDFNNLLIRQGTKETSVTLREAELLKYFVENQNAILKREDILNAIWGNDDYFLGRSLDVFMSRLRKIFKGDKNVSFENVHGVGFRLKVRE